MATIKFSEATRKLETCSAMNKFPLLPCQGNPNEEETLMSFVLRTANLNNIHGIYWLYQLLDREKIKRFKYEDCPSIASIFGADIDLVRSAMPRSRRIDGVTVYDIYKHRFSKSYLIRPLRPQICPKCMMDFGYSKMEWDLLFVCACPEHFCELVDHCPQCGNSIRWARPFFSECNCGFAWERISPKWVPDTSPCVRVAAILRNKLRFPDLRDIPNDPFENAIAALSISTISRLLWIFGIRESSQDYLVTGKRKKTLRTSQIAECCQRGFLRLKQLIFSADTLESEQGVSAIHISSLRSFIEETNTAADINFMEQIFQRLTQYPSFKRHLSGVMLPQRLLF
jgi:hypothetical protein